MLQRIRSEDQGVLTFEWILLITVIILGIVGGLSAVRDGLIDELGDVAEAALCVDQSWSVQPSDCLDDDVDFGGYEDDGNPQVTRQRPVIPEEPPDVLPWL